MLAGVEGRGRGRGQGELGLGRLASDQNFESVLSQKVKGEIRISCCSFQLVCATTVLAFLQTTGFWCNKSVWNFNSLSFEGSAVVACDVGLVVYSGHVNLVYHSVQMDHLSSYASRLQGGCGGLTSS